MLLRYLAGPLIGSVIGYFTNYIAVKMLFYPRKEIYLFGHKLPFTPGAIPKGKDRLGRAIGRAVGDMLLTREDIEKKLLAPEVTTGVVDAMTAGLASPIKTSIRQAAGLTEYDYIMGREKLSKALTVEITHALSEVDLSEIIVDKGIQMVHEYLTNPMLAMFVTDDLLRSILGPMGPKLQEMINTEGPDLIEPVVTAKIRELEQQSAMDLMNRIDMEEHVLRAVLSAVVQRTLQGNLSKVLDSLNIQKTVEQKIHEMSIEELEELVLTVMKKELNTIVNLGALIGFVLGLINLLF
ncbi:MAG: DUF445 family protein [Lachnospiraceae bacterium]|nr:DUF445 family protein [Lachnospiraceae bacterium]